MNDLMKDFVTWTARANREAARNAEEGVENVLGSVAEFERSMMLERQAVGIAKAKAEGRYRGRAPTARRKASEIEALLEEGLGPVDISKKLGIARSSVYRVAEKVIRARREERERLLARE